MSASQPPMPSADSDTEKAEFEAPKPVSKDVEVKSEPNGDDTSRKRAASEASGHVDTPSTKRTKTSENICPNDNVAIFLAEGSEKTSDQFKVMPCPLVSLNGNTRVYQWTAKALKELAESLGDSDEAYFVV